MLGISGRFARPGVARIGADWSELSYYRRRAAKVGRIALDVSRTGYTGDLGYELWVDAARAVALWDRLVEVGRDFGLAAAGMLLVVPAERRLIGPCMFHPEQREARILHGGAKPPGVVEEAAGGFDFLREAPFPLDLYVGAITRMRNEFVCARHEIQVR